MPGQLLPLLLQAACLPALQYGACTALLPVSPAAAAAPTSNCVALLLLSAAGGATCGRNWLAYTLPTPLLVLSITASKLCASAP